jgi:SIR2-like domain
MPRFIKNGPIVPDRLIQDLEDDRVVIFCGAGVSANGGLPDFPQLVKYCYTELGAPLPKPKDAAWNWLDRMLGALESDFPGEMRRKVAERLDKDATDLAIHKAILKLSRLKSARGYRLVTTNFDRFFEQAETNLALGIDYHSGPILPIPRDDRNASWRSIVYLHGRLASEGESNDHLVLTSGDFGRAYLTDAWAARFVTRLFAEFTILFIGYSLNDPVLRYMTDAFAAEDALARSGRKRGPAYIFVSYKTKLPDPKEWTKRNLEPIFYRERPHHRALKSTLIEWAKARDDYLASVGTIIRRDAALPPNALEPSSAANVVWAVCGRPDDGGSGAKVFAELAKRPPIEWLMAFEQRDVRAREAHELEVRLAKTEGREPPEMPPLHIEALFPGVAESFRYTSVMPTAFHLMHWLCRHLDSKELADWIIQKIRIRRRPHPQLRLLIRRELDRNKSTAAGYAKFWQIATSEGDWAVNPLGDEVWSDLLHDLSGKQSSALFDQELAAAMRPYLVLTQGFHGAGGEDVVPDDFRTIAHAEVQLAAHDIATYFVEQIDSGPEADQFWANRLDWLTAALKRVFDLYAVVDEAGWQTDPSMMQRPSIEPHDQNKYRANWAMYFDLLWRGWSKIDSESELESKRWILHWQQIPYLGFRRLVLAAITKSAHFTPQEKLEALLNG